MAHINLEDMVKYRQKTNLLGVYERRSAMRKHRGKSDVCYDITYKADGKKKWEKVGWASEGYNAKLASYIRAERIRSIRHGKELSEVKKKVITLEMPVVRKHGERFLDVAEADALLRAIGELLHGYTRVSPSVRGSHGPVKT